MTVEPITMEGLANLIRGVGAGVVDLQRSVGGLDARMEKQEAEGIDLKKEVVDIKKQLEQQKQEIEKLKTISIDPPAALRAAGAYAAAASTMTTEPTRNRTESESAEEKKRDILEKARRTIGFEPIDAVDVGRQFKESGSFGMARNEEEARIMAVQEFMLLDMRISREELEKMEIRRVFAPRREGTATLYCEFTDLRSTFTVFRHTRRMKRGSNVVNYVPAEYYEQYRALESICYDWRKGEGYKTKVRMGRAGFEVWRKRGHEQYTEVPLTSLGELPAADLQRKAEAQSSNLERSPAGRPGHTPRRKRVREPGSEGASPASRSPSGKRVGGGGGLAGGGEDGEDGGVAGEQERNEQERNKQERNEQERNEQERRKREENNISQRRKK
jgi:hypothetical protein